MADGNRTPTEQGSGNSVAQADLVRLMEVLGIPTHARPESPHEVFENEVLPAVKSQVNEIERLREYADHKPSCNKRKFGPQFGEEGRTCTCGLEAFRE